MRMASLVDLKNHTSEIFRKIHGGGAFIFTYRGKPWILSLPLPPDADIEEVLFWHSDFFKKRLKAAEESTPASKKEILHVLRSKNRKTRRQHT